MDILKWYWIDPCRVVTEIRFIDLFVGSLGIKKKRKQST